MCIEYNSRLTAVMNLNIINCRKPAVFLSTPVTSYARLQFFYSDVSEIYNRAVA